MKKYVKEIEYSYVDKFRFGLKFIYNDGSTKFKYIDEIHLQAVLLKLIKILNFKVLGKVLIPNDYFDFIDNYLNIDDKDAAEREEYEQLKARRIKREEDIVNQYYESIGRRPLFYKYIDEGVEWETWITKDGKFEVKKLQ